MFNIYLFRFLSPTELFTHGEMPNYSVKQSDRNSSKTYLFHKPTNFDQRVKTRSEQKITFARHEYGQVGVFRIKMKSLVQKL